jgi:hypothetical protein
MTSLYDLIIRLRHEFLADTVGEDDPTTTYRWGSSNIANALNEAQKEIARKTLMIQDSTTSSVCSLLLTADPITGLYPQTLALNSKVLRVRFVLFPHSDLIGSRSLYRSTTESMNQHSRGCWGHEWAWIGKVGCIKHYITDFQYRSITFDRVPNHGGTVQIGTYRLPLVDMVYTDEDAAKLIYPEIQEQDIALIHGALKHLYSKEYERKDSETYDPIEMTRWKKEFDEDIDQITRDLAAFAPKETIVQPENW